MSQKEWAFQYFVDIFIKICLFRHYSFNQKIALQILHKNHVRLEQKLFKIYISEKTCKVTDLGIMNDRPIIKRNIPSDAA